MNTMGESDYGRGYREGFRAASGHYPGCPRLFAHTYGATVCGECGATFRGPWSGAGGNNPAQHGEALIATANEIETGPFDIGDIVRVYDQGEVFLTNGRITHVYAEADTDNTYRWCYDVRSDDGERFSYWPEHLLAPIKN